MAEMSGRTALNGIQQAIKEEQERTRRLDAELAAANEQLVKIDVERGKRFKELARLRLKFLSGDDILSRIDQTDRQALALLAKRSDVIAGIRSRLDDSEAARSEFYQIIKNEADRLGRLIDNMLNISRIEAGIVKIDRTEVDFIKAARGAIEVIQPQAKLKNINVHLKASPLACTAMADADMIQQVMLNLLSNSVKYTPEGGRVTVTVENDDATRSAMVTVADTGLGIPPDAMPRMFQKFYRIENYKRVAKGTGLGLALVKHIVETVHHGHVGVTSELGMGSKFTFTIPYDYEAA